MKHLYITLIGVLFSAGVVNAQATSCTSPYNIGTPGATETCTPALSGTKSQSPCTGQGGWGTGVWVRFCTNAQNECVILSGTSSGTSDAMMVRLYTLDCNVSTTPVQSFHCGTNTDGTVNYSTTSNDPAPNDKGTVANTCYIAFIWTSTEKATISVCSSTQTPANDECAGAMAIDGTVQEDSNYCMTEAGASDPPANQFCAGTLENTAWYVFTANADGDASVVISNIDCDGGGDGFQMGLWNGSCSSLNYISCTSGSGGDVTANFTNLTAGDTYYFGIDGNAGANCTYGITATNAVPLSANLVDFDAWYNEHIDKVEITWLTSVERNNSHFVIQRSKDNVNYTPVGKVLATDDEDLVLNRYVYSDGSALNGDYYYRIVAVSNNETQSLYDPKSVSVKKLGNDVSIYPSPSDKELNVTFRSTSTDKALIKLFGIDGKIIKQLSVEATKGRNLFMLDVSDLTTGIYFLVIETESGIKSSVSKFSKL
jgi:hypothetical protein